MYEVIYKITPSDSRVVLLTESEMSKARALWYSGSDFFCKRLKTDLSRFKAFAGPEKNSERFKHYVYSSQTDRTLKLPAQQFLYDTYTDKVYKFARNQSFRQLTENLIARENGGEAPLIVTEEEWDEEQRELMKKVFMTFDEYLDNGEVYDPFLSEEGKRLSPTQEPRFLATQPAVVKR